ncbi:MAG: hypothetical protein NTZ61_14170, partial [Proteobacteria bacterium]|nr:hypothetical protein [Pseudomonadota bacterium]
MINRTRRTVAAAALAVAFLVPTQAAQPSDDTALFSVTVPPNVMLMVDNSGSMENIVWHPDFNASTTYSCNRTNGFTAEQSFNSVSKSFTKCGKTRTLYSDPKLTALSPAHDTD